MICPVKPVPGKPPLPAKPTAARELASFYERTAIAYLRDGDGIGTYTPALQRVAVRRWNAAQPSQYRFTDEFVEVVQTRGYRRPKLFKALTLCRRNNSVLVIARIDKLIRDKTFINQILRSEIAVASCELSQLFEPTQSRRYWEMLASFVAFEGELTANSIRAGLMEAKSRGIAMGNPQPKERMSNLAGDSRRAAADDFALSLYPYLQRLLNQGFTYRRIADWLNSRPITTRTGRSWTTLSVSRVLNRLKQIAERHGYVAPPIDAPKSGGSPISASNGYNR